MKQVMVVTGATQGLGLAIVQSFLEKGWIVVGLARNESKLSSLKQKFGENFDYYQADVRDTEKLSIVFQKILKRWEQIDILVNNAAVVKMENFMNCTISDINNIIDTNLKGTMFCTLEAIKAMKGKGGRIINVSSVAGTHGIERQAIYCASKHGLTGFADALNQEVIKEGILVSTICPGAIDTPLWNEDNPYPRNIEDVMKPEDVVSTIELITQLPMRVLLKNLTLFPTNEWH